ncbi:Transcription-repair coupling factor [Rubellimicrobium mesophilum DSM 19309]|uniref:Transcription-repair-coupling factor n=1 Tax=Rubellimicrobium mesophilum DSM 19309 TaxID=442562 RepID=A0A017HWY4_9RHOB|nr:DEAD/DEAH box helicase [Rubellimicrobium mesophilum]EYD78264.1 Transcription-repair coupling factor [Rubellimicrobium mesophilum DSM 19309]
MINGIPLGLEATRLLALWRDGGRTPILHATAGETRAEDIARLLREVAPETRAVAFPPWDVLPYDWAAPSPQAMGRRMAVLRQLADPGAAPGIVVATPAALLRRVPPVGAERQFTAQVGEPLDPEALRAFCAGAGYRLDERVDEPGEVAIRGEVVDLFDPDEGWPYRIEVGDTVTAIRRYDPATQRSVEDIDRLVIDAASEVPGRAEDEEERGIDRRLLDAYPTLVPFFDHLPGARLTLGPGAARARDGALAVIAEAFAERRRHDGPSGRVPGPERLYLSAEDWDRFASERGTVEMDAAGAGSVPAFAEANRPRGALAGFLRAQGEAGRRIVLMGHAGRDKARLARRLREATGESPATVPDWDAVLAAEPGRVVALAAGLDRGFVDEARRLAVISPREVLGSRAGVARAEGSATAWAVVATELHEGDLVVHLEHGVAKLDGLESVEVEGLDGEAIALGYAEGQRLLVPSSEAGRVWRYGSDEGEVALDRLNTAGWDRRRAKVMRGLAETARGLIRAAGERQARTAPKLVPEPAPYEAVAARFPYEETPDQARAIRDALADMASGTPMDRLVIGDVGFGKTEVAIRAAAACAFAGRQVMLLAPTTVLARQHHRNLQRRFEGSGVEVAHLSRLVGASQAKRVKAGLRDGGVRIVVGTQALLSDTVEFADLGLAIIDEEQRLGLEHKNRVRALAGDGHLLTMTATPIPRTLQSALVGLQDLSVIATPPARRRPIRTTMSNRDAATLRQALLREKRRGGQSFVVVPRVEDVGPMAEELQRLLPRFDLRVAHGQLPAKEIDEVMVAFAEGEGDVLLATSIIESGLDVPRANTMVVLRPDLFGLAQLHQLRGRVGRGGAQAYCLLMTEEGQELSPATVKRLGTLQALDRLGAGMAISAQDLDLRGGGELFGERQTGHVRLIGLALYQELLADAIRAARGEPAIRREVEFRAEAMGTLPPDYIPEPEVRVNLYHRLARTLAASDVERMEEEVADRFGPPPPEVVALLRAARIRALARALGVTRISAGPEAVALDFEPGSGAEEHHAETVEASGGRLQWLKGRLVLRQASADADARMALVLDLLEEIA